MNKAKDFAIVGGTVITPKEELSTNVWLHEGMVEALGDAAPKGSDRDFEKIDAKNCYVTPGLIDLQVNGTADCDLWDDPNDKDIRKLRLTMLRHGVTAFLPTIITADVDLIRKNIGILEKHGVSKLNSKTTACDANGDSGLAKMPGIHLEGPCLSPKRPGVHPKEWLKPLNVEVVDQLLSPNVVLMTLAPELDPSYKAVDHLKERGVSVSLGHSNATFDEANIAFNHGIKLVTHTFNALPPLLHRDPGALGAAFLDDKVTCAVICDGLHVNPDVVRLLLKIKGCENVLLVTDIAKIGTSQGNLVGSSIYLDEAVRNVVKWKAATFREAIFMASWKPAEAINLHNVLGQIAPTKSADIVIWDKKTLAVKHAIVNGVLAF